MLFPILLILIKSGFYYDKEVQNYLCNFADLNIASLNCLKLF